MSMQYVVVLGNLNTSSSLTVTLVHLCLPLRGKSAGMSWEVGSDGCLYRISAGDIPEGLGVLLNSRSPRVKFSQLMLPDGAVLRKRYLMDLTAAVGLWVVQQ